MKFNQKQFMSELLLDVKELFFEPLVEKTPEGKTKTVKKSWKITIEGDYITISNTEGIIIKFLEEGTKSHIITPKNKKSLKFTSNNKEVFTKKVQHPGTKALKFIYGVMNDRKRWEELYTRIAERNLKVLTEQAFT